MWGGNFRTPANWKGSHRSGPSASGTTSSSHLCLGWCASWVTRAQYVPVSWQLLAVCASHQVRQLLGALLREVGASTGRS